MENSELFSLSTVQMTWQDFLDRMRQPSAAEFVKAIKSFIVSSSNSPPDPERDSAAVQQFLANMEAAFRAHPLWAGCSEEELDSAGEGLEKYVMTKLYNRVFASVPDDVEADEQLSEKMALFQQFIRPENLDIKHKFQNESSWLLAQKELQKINMYKAPREKLACIMNCCKVITNLLHNAAVTANEDPPGADEFLPVLIYVTLKANPPQLHSNLQYIQRYRRHSRMVSETAYYFTNILSVVSFISNIDAQSLSMDDTDFDRNMESARALLSGLTSNLESATTVSASNQKPVEHRQQASPPTGKDPIGQSQRSSHPSVPRSGSLEDLPVKDQSSISKSMSISDFEEKGASVILKEDGIDNIFQEFPYVFASVGNLTLRDVEDLLGNYKQLVCKYVCLTKGLGVAPSPPTSLLPQAEGQSAVETVAGSQSSGVLETNVNGKLSRELEESNKTSLPDTGFGDSSQSNKTSLPDTRTGDSSQSQEEAVRDLQGAERNDVSRSADSEQDVSQDKFTVPSDEDNNNKAVEPSTAEQNDDA